MTLSRRAGVKLLASSFLLAGDAIAFAKTTDFWNKQPPEDWTKDEIQQLISDSPWAKPVVAENRAYSPQSPISGGGRRGRMGSSRNTNPEATAAKFPGFVRWLSAKPMMIAMKLTLPPGFEGHYVIGVSGMPVISGHSQGESGDSYDALKEVTQLEVKGQEPAQPGIIQQDPSDTSTVLIGFLHQFLDLSAAKVAEFKTTNGPFEIKAKFDLKQMKYRGELAV